MFYLLIVFPLHCDFERIRNHFGSSVIIFKHCIRTFFRFDFIKLRFSEAYGRSPVFIGRAPGRVNLIGKNDGMINTLCIIA